MRIGPLPLITVSPALKFRVEGLGDEVEGLGLRVQGMEVWGQGFGLGFGVWGLSVGVPLSTPIAGWRGMRRGETCVARAKPPVTTYTLHPPH